MPTTPIQATPKDADLQLMERRDCARGDHADVDGQPARPQLHPVTTTKALDEHAYRVDSNASSTSRSAPSWRAAARVRPGRSTHSACATGLSCNWTNFIPRTVRPYVECYERGDLAAANQIYADLHRFNRFVEQWRGARWQKRR